MTIQKYLKKKIFKNLISFIFPRNKLKHLIKLLYHLKNHNIVHISYFCTIVH